MEAPMQGYADEGSGHAVDAALAAPAATVLHAGRRLDVPPGGLGIGRRSDNEVVLASDRVSRHHTRIAADGGRWYVADLGSMNGTYLNGERLNGESRWLSPGDTVTVGGEALRFVTGDETRFGAPAPARSRSASVTFTGAPLRIGRDAANDVVLQDPNVSRFHAEIALSGGSIAVRDLGSSNGTRLNGVAVGSAGTRLLTGAEVAIGPYRLLV